MASFDEQLAVKKFGRRTPPVVEKRISDFTQFQTSQKGKKQVHVEGTSYDIAPGVYRDSDNRRIQVLSDGGVLNLRGDFLSEDALAAIPPAPSWLADYAKYSVTETPQTVRERTVFKEEAEQILKDVPAGGGRQTEALRKAKPKLAAEQDLTKQRTVTDLKRQGIIDSNNNVDLLKAAEAGVARRTFKQIGLTDTDYRTSQRALSRQRELARADAVTRERLASEAAILSAKRRAATADRDEEFNRKAQQVAKAVDDEGGIASALQAGEVNRSELKRYLTIDGKPITDVQINAALKGTLTTAKAALERQQSIRASASQQRGLNRIAVYQVRGGYDLVAVLEADAMTQAQLKALFPAQAVKAAVKARDARKTLRSKGFDTRGPVSLTDVLASGIKPSLLETAGFKNKDILEALDHEFTRTGLNNKYQRGGGDTFSTLFNAVYEGKVDDATLRKGGYTQQAIDAARRQAAAQRFFDKAPAKASGNYDLKGNLPLVAGTTAIGVGARRGGRNISPQNVAIGALVVAAGILVAAKLTEQPPRTTQLPTNTVQRPPSTIPFPKTKLGQDTIGFPTRGPKVVSGTTTPRNSGVDVQPIQRATSTVATDVDNETVKETLERIDRELKDKAGPKAKPGEERALEEALNIILGKGSSAIRRQYDRLDDDQRRALLQSLVEEARRYIVSTIGPRTPNRQQIIAEYTAAVAAGLTAALEEGKRASVKAAIERATTPAKVDTSTATVAATSSTAKVAARTAASTTTARTTSTSTATAATSKVGTKRSTTVATAQGTSNSTPSAQGASDADASRAKAGVTGAGGASQPRYVLPSGEALAPGRKPWVIEFVDGLVRHRIDLLSGRRTFQASRTPGSPTNTFKVVSTTTRTIPSRRYDLGAFDYVVTSNRIRFIPDRRQQPRMPRRRRQRMRH